MLGLHAEVSFRWASPRTVPAVPGAVCSVIRSLTALVAWSVREWRSDRGRKYWPSSRGFRLEIGTWIPVRLGLGGVAARRGSRIGSGGRRDGRRWNGHLAR